MYKISISEQIGFSLQSKEGWKPEEIQLDKFVSDSGVEIVFVVLF